MTFRATCLALMSVVCAVHCSTAESIEIVSTTMPSGDITATLRNEIDAAIDRGLDWLAARQKENGSWSDERYPALTALPLRAFAVAARPQDTGVATRATAFVLSCVQPDGGIYVDIPGRKGGGLGNYNTAISMTALHALGDRGLVPTIQKARAYVMAGQHHGDDIYKGGFGYDQSTKRAYTDILNTLYAAEAMRVTQDVEDLRPAKEKRVDIDWGETVKYVQRLQNTNDVRAEDAGGFFYSPDPDAGPKAGIATNDAGVTYFRSYGSITYVGLLALIYANVAPLDTRVVSAVEWSGRHWSLEENPGMGPQGLYFFYNVLARALSASRRDLIPAAGGGVINWRQALGSKLVSVQSIDADTGEGFWANENNRFWERDPVLVTAYTLLALQLL